MASQLFGLHTGDPASFALSAVILVIVAAVAAIVPAQRASRVDPMYALRAD